MSDKVRGGHNSALAEVESLHDASSVKDPSPNILRRTSVSDGGQDDTGTDPPDRRRNSSAGHRPGSQSLPRFAADVLRTEGARKVDSLPVNLRGATHERDPSQERKRRAKGVMRSLGQFVQKVARQISSVSVLAKAKVADNYSSSRRQSADELTSSRAPTDSDNDRGKTSAVVKDDSDGNSVDVKCPGVIGIHNHGNTCYMNAVLQCLSNTERLLSYFVMDQYKDDMKRNSRHNSKKFGGTHGELTEQLATLLRSLWTCKYTPEISVEFKAVVGKYGVQYRGAMQHDAQEFLMWLLDKVHEDLNIATKKKYRANKSSYGRSDEDIAAEALANHARCNNSFIYDVFQASFRSSLACPNCGHRSNTFDPFLSVSLPIPHKTNIPVCVIVVRHAAVLGPARQTRLGLLLDQDCLVKELRHTLATETKINNAQSILLLELNGEGFGQTFSDSQSVCDLSEIDGIYAVETPPPAEQPLPALVTENKRTSSESSRADVTSTVNPKVDKSGDVDNSTSVDSPSHADTLNANKEVPPPSADGEENPPRLGPPPSSDEKTCQLGVTESVDSVIAAPDDAEVVERNIVVILLNKIFTAGSPSKRFGCPLVVSLSTRSSFKEICRKIDDVLCPMMMRPPVSTAHSVAAAAAPSYRLQVVNEYQTDYYLTSEDEYPLCSEIIEKSLSNWVSANGPSHLRVFIEWTQEDKDRYFPSSSPLETIEDDESVKQVKVAQQQTIIGTLDECFQVYTQEERLDADNAWLCPNCRKYQQGTLKALSLWSLPEILVIHLKRFRQDAVQRTKLNTLVTFPVNGLDLRHHVQKVVGGGSTASHAGTSHASHAQQPHGNLFNSGSKLLGSSWLSWKPGRKTTDSSDEYVYDLYAVCNHYGNMQGGHYTAFCKNPADDKWYSFNDSRATEMREEEVITRAAYLIFYHKRVPSGAGAAGGAIGGGGRGSEQLRSWLERLHLVESIPRTVTSHSLDDLLDADNDATVSEAGSDDSFRSKIPLYTEHSPPPRITRHASVRHTSSNPSPATTATATASTTEPSPAFGLHLKSSEPPVPSPLVTGSSDPEESRRGASSVASLHSESGGASSVKVGQSPGVSVKTAGHSPVAVGRQSTLTGSKVLAPGSVKSSPTVTANGSIDNVSSNSATFEPAKKNHLLGSSAVSGEKLVEQRNTFMNGKEIRVDHYNDTNKKNTGDSPTKGIVGNGKANENVGELPAKGKIMDGKSNSNQSIHSLQQNTTYLNQSTKARQESAARGDDSLDERPFTDRTGRSTIGGTCRPATERRSRPIISGMGRPSSGGAVFVSPKPLRKSTCTLSGTTLPSATTTRSSSPKTSYSSSSTSLLVGSARSGTITSGSSRTGSSPRAGQSGAIHAGQPVSLKAGSSLPPQSTQTVSPARSNGHRLSADRSVDDRVSEPTKLTTGSSGQLKVDKTVNLGQIGDGQSTASVTGGDGERRSAPVVQRNTVNRT